MAKMFNDVKFKAHEKHAIDSAWHVLDSIATRNGSSCAQALMTTLRQETTGSHSVPPLFAKGLICEWFTRYSKSVPCPRDLLGTRSILIACMADDVCNGMHKRPPTQPELDCLAAAATFKDIAFKRSRG